ncbi:MAG: GspE/PulE family protein [Planctomycetota bacterium]|jgi:type II secretory ATPase GspE/PulE/Tfp pilus assembly ATPase PilB-like protein
MGDGQGSDAVSLVDDILRRAIDARASDAHIEPTGDGVVVRFRLDGILKTIETLPPAVGDSLVNRLKVLAGLLTYRNDIPQEGRIQRTDEAGDDVRDQRLAVFPTIHGQRAVVRFFYDERSLTELDQLGFSGEVLGSLQRITARSQGVLLLTGPAGSGKSTTLAALLRHLQQQSPGKSIVTVEDPVERRIGGVTQIEIAPHGELTFPVALRSLLRQDPQVLMIGEIRDAETARAVVEAGLTGHLLMSTMHSGSPAGALLRLMEMGIEPYQITSSIAGVLNQRLVRRLCGACGGAGCQQCLGEGYHGRALVAELVELNGNLRRAVLARADREELDSILAGGGHVGLADDGQRLVGEGITTHDELWAVCRAD